MIGTVHFGGIEQGDAPIDGGGHGIAGFVHIDVAVLGGAHLPGAKAQSRTGQVGVAKEAMFHDGLLIV